MRTPDAEAAKSRRPFTRVPDGRERPDFSRESKGPPHPDDAAMGFSALVEGLDMLARPRRRKAEEWAERGTAAEGLIPSPLSQPCRAGRRATPGPFLRGAGEPAPKSTVC